MTWTPLLNRDDAARALDAVRAIAADLRDPAAHNGALNIANGSAGLALFYAYAARVFDDEEYARAADEFLGEAIDKLTSHDTVLVGLLSGFTGVAWVNHHLDRVLFDGGAVAGDHGNEPLDEDLQALLARPGWDDEYDLVGGLVGIGVYGIDHVCARTGQAIVARVNQHLAELARRDDRGAYWFTPASRMLPSVAAQYPDGNTNLGLAHGVPGVIAYLGSAVAAGYDEVRSRALLDAAVSWLLSAKNREAVDSVFPYNDAQPGNCRSGWCYGDPGVAAALLTAARATGNAAWESEALAIARRAARRDVKSSQVKDAGLCHGFAGLAHIYNRFYHATGEELFAEVARRWYGHALDQRGDEGIGGYQVWIALGELEKPSWQTRADLLAGAAGIGLALLAAASDIAPDWDRTLLTDLPLQ